MTAPPATLTDALLARLDTADPQRVRELGMLLASYGTLRRYSHASGHSLIRRRRALALAALELLDGDGA